MVLLRMMLQRMMLQTRAPWKRPSTLAFPLSLQTQHSASDGTTGLRIANWVLLSPDTVNLNAAHEGTKSRKKKDKKKKKGSKGKNMEKEKEKVEELAEPLSELRALSGVGLV